MKPFDLEAAKAGAPVCTRDGKTVRIICFDRKDTVYPLVGLVLDDGEEPLLTFTEEGRHNITFRSPSNYDLFMASIKQSVVKYVNIYPSGPDHRLYDSRKYAVAGRKEGAISTVVPITIEWEE